MLISPWILPHSEPKDGHYKLPRTSSENICIPAQLQATVPGCALECLRTFVLNNYSNHACSSTANLSFLCKNPTFSGLTIGEGSLQCVVSSCFNFNAQTQSGYTICDGMADAIPNLAETITATISAINSLTASQPSISVTSDLSFPAPPATTTESSTPATPLPSSGVTVSTPPDVTFTSSLNGLSTSDAPPSVIPTIGATTEGSSATPTTTGPQASVGNTNSTRGSTTSATQSSSSTGTSAAANLPAAKTTLSTSAIAGIATASVVAIALVLGYLAYFLIFKRKARKNRRSQRLSKFFPPIDDNDTAGTGSSTIEDKNATADSSDRRFYSGEIREAKRTSLGRQSTVAPSNIGIAVTQDAFRFQERGEGPAGTPQPRLTPSLVQQRQQIPEAQEDRWSAVSSLNDDVEAQTQDVPILASLKSRSSARSFSSTRIPKSPLLRLSKVKPSVEKRKSRIALTPVYDNGNFEPTIRQVLDDPDMRTESSESVSLVQLPAKSVSRGNNRPFWSQNRQTLQRFPIKIALEGRKRSDPSIRSVSVYTEIEEDSTPEVEEDKQLTAPKLAASSNDRMPLRDLAWPQIPRSASIAKQAVKPHSPRKIPINRAINLAEIQETLPKQIRHKPVLTRNETSTTTIQTESSASPVFPLPPSRSAAPPQTRANGKLMRQISDAYQAAASPVTKTPTQTDAQVFGRSDPRSRPQTPGQTYQSIQRLRTGRPLAQGLPQPGFPPPIPPRSPLRGKAPPFPINNNRRPREISQNF